LTERETNDPVGDVFGVFLIIELHAHRFSRAGLTRGGSRGGLGSPKPVFMKKMMVLKKKHIIISIIK